MSDYTPSGAPVTSSSGSSSAIRAEFALIQTAIASKADSASPTLTTPTLGVATATSINKITLTQPATGATLTLTDGKTLSVAKTLTLTGTDGTTMTFPATSASVARIDAAQTFTGIQDFDGRIDANAGLAVTGANFTSRGITDSATAVALTLSGSGANSVTIANSATSPTIGTTAGALNLSPANHVVNVGAAAANYPSLFGSAGASVGISAAGSASDISFVVTAKGAGNIAFTGNSAIQVQVIGTASADRYITLTGSDGGNPTIGTSAGAVSFNPIAQGEVLRVTTGGASTVNYWSLSGALTGNRLTLLATGSDTNVGASWQTKGSGSHLFVTETGASAQVEIKHTASATRYITLTGSNGGNPTIGTSGGSLALSSVINYIGTDSTDYGALYGGTGAFTIQATGGSANVALQLIAKGTGSITFGNLTETQVAVTNTASANRYITLTGSNGGNPTIGTSAGDLFLAPAGDIGLRIAAIAGTVANYLAAIPSATIDPLLSSNTGSIYLGGAAGAEEVRVVNTGASTRHITLTGSNGGNPTIGTSAGALNIASGAGNVTINAGAAALNAALSVTCTGVSGCAIQLVGNGATTPNKFIRSFSGNLEIVDSGFAAAIVQISDVGSIAANTATAIPAGGTAGVGLKVSSTANFGVFFGSGAPSLSAAKGSIYLRSDGSTTNNRMYVNTDGGTTWTAVTTAA